jgi:HK97 family phage major capsid protein
MTREEIMNLSAEECEERKAAIRSEMDAEGADIHALSDEADAICERISALKKAAEERAALAAKVAGGEGTVIKTFKEETKMDEKRSYTDASPEYRSGFLKSLLGQELTEEERSAISFVATTNDATYGSGNVLPHTMLNQVWDLISEQHAILGDITLYRTGTILEVAKRTAISQGDAATVAENAANDDEVNTFAKVTLTGKDFSKHVNVSYAMAKMSVEALESFLVNEIADRIGAALAADIVTQIGTDFDSTHNAITTAAEKKLAFAEVAAAMGALKNAFGQAVVYANRATVYKYLVGMVDTTGRPIFQVNAQNGAEGNLIGCPVKVEDAVSDNILWIGYPKQVVGNMVQDIMVETDRDIKKHVITYAGYARFECRLLAPAAFAKITVDQGT